MQKTTILLNYVVIFMLKAILVYLLKAILLLLAESDPTFTC